MGNRERTNNSFSKIFNSECSAGVCTFLCICKIHPNTEIMDRNLSLSKVVTFLYVGTCLCLGLVQPFPELPLPEKYGNKFGLQWLQRPKVGQTVSILNKTLFVRQKGQDYRLVRVWLYPTVRFCLNQWLRGVWKYVNCMQL